MTLKTLELNGFKSFGKKSALSFTTPITCIVGPNGSGKSNIVEAIRFVLGEQSMKSLRGKGGVDLIFKGSKTLSSQNRAQVTMTFDNSKKIFSFTNSDLSVSLDYDEINISREVFADGSNRYAINGTEVRLKDIVDLLASVNIGSSGHHIISQGEADRVLNASSKDRRAMIEDALGLKVYQYRIRESERKLEKTLENIKEVQILRREVAPHLLFLKKQVTLIEKARELRDEIRELYKIYFSSEATYINTEGARLREKRRLVDERIVSLDERIARLPSSLGETKELSEEATHAILLEEEISRIRTEKDETGRKLGRIEGLIERIERDLSRVAESPEKTMTEHEWKEMLHAIEEEIDNALQSNDMAIISLALRALKDRIHKLSTDSNNSSPNPTNPSLIAEHAEMVKARDVLIAQINEYIAKEQEIVKTIALLRQKDSESQQQLRESERVRYELLREQNIAQSDLHSLSFEEEKLTLIKSIFETDIAEAGALIGREVIDFARIEMAGEITRQTQEELRRKIERIKIKIEDSGMGNSSDVIKEYEDTEERDRFLAREIDDLNTSIRTLRDVIVELKETLDREFKTGVEKINRQFQEFFALMFGGGSAFLSIVMEHKKPKRGEEDEEEESTDEESTLGFERGIEIHVSLPQKKVKDLHMLSGGERSLTSIALLFAMSQVNPPPFLVLDETDAALDEANSRKYGNMLENLSRVSQLVVVTHNRETMSRAQILYGVTMGAEGASKLLSIHLEDASTYAK